MKHPRVSPLAPYRVDPVEAARYKAAPYLDTAGGAPLPWPMKPRELLTVIGAGLAALVAAFTLLPGMGWPVPLLLMMAITMAVARRVYPGKVSAQTRRLRLAQARVTYRHDATDGDLSA